MNQEEFNEKMCFDKPPEQYPETIFKKYSNFEVTKKEKFKEIIECFHENDIDIYLVNSFIGVGRKDKGKTSSLLFAIQLIDNALYFEYTPRKYFEEDKKFEWCRNCIAEASKPDNRLIADKNNPSYYVTTEKIHRFLFPIENKNFWDNIYPELIKRFVNNNKIGTRKAHWPIDYKDLNNKMNDDELLKRFDWDGDFKKNFENAGDINQKNFYNLARKLHDQRLDWYFIGESATRQLRCGQKELLDTRAKATLVAFDLSRKDQYFKIRFENDPQGSGIELKEFIDKLTTEKINEVIKKNLERKGHWPDQYGKDESNDSDDTNENSKTEEDNSVPLNTILYGPPGTGKTYKTAQKAIEICGAKGKDRPAIMDEYKKLCDGKRISFVTFHQSYGYEEFVEGLRPMLKDDTPSDKLKVETVPVVAKSARDVQYEIRDGAFKMLCEVARGKDELYVIIIDEINRGNISKIFGELISLIEEDKRSGEVNELTVTLPYSQEAFSVPKNVYIIGTMNTADRSLALVDTALRRRFHFEETMPDTQVLDELTINGVDISLMLATMNRRIEALYDREHTIGHAYFTELMGIEKGNKFNALKNIFQNKIIPLLEEYFFEDWEKIRKVLGDNQKKDAAHQFITSAPCEWQELFGEKQDDDFHQADEKKTYTFNEVAFGKPQSYIEIYQR